MIKAYIIKIILGIIFILVWRCTNYKIALICVCAFYIIAFILHYFGIIPPSYDFYDINYYK